MKTQNNPKLSFNLAGSNNQPPARIRQTTKPMEHRHERRRIREELRRLDWVHTVEDEIFA
jgi:hypothetical protein